MSLRGFWLALLRWPVRWLTRYEFIRDTHDEDETHDTRRLVYVMRSTSATDMLVARRALTKAGLPDPCEPLVLNQREFARVMFLAEAEPDSSQQAVDEFHELLQQHQTDPKLAIQVVPVGLFWGRRPGEERRQGHTMVADVENPGMWRKFWLVMFSGRNILVRVSRPVSLRQMADEFGSDGRIAKKLARVARVHFTRMRHAVAGPNLMRRDEVIAELISTPALQKAIRDEAKSRKCDHEEAQKTAEKYLHEIAANYSDTLVRMLDRFMTWMWSRIYNGIHVNGGDRIRRLAQQGHEVVYVPCHRSHMDYLLLSYVIYKEGLVPPHIAAGVNLDFFPVGSLFRRGGAFFIRRSFRGNKLYSAVFREYLCRLFQKGYPVKYFTEGGRSRTGRLLPPKTGMIAMTLQGMLRGQNRPISLVPVYLGYEHVMEVGTYLKELKGKSKEKESMFQVLKTLRKLRNFGQGYVTFGQPIALGAALDDLQPNWRDDITRGIEEPSRPKWLTPTVNVLAQTIMQRINDSAALNSVNLTALALLSAEHHALTKEELIAQLDVYAQLLREVPYSEVAYVPNESGAELWAQASSLDKFTVTSDSMGDVVQVDGATAIAMTYYRNNIIHLIIIPALVASYALSRQQFGTVEITRLVQQLYPMLQAELFMSYDLSDIEVLVPAIIEELLRQELLEASPNQPGLWHPARRDSKRFFKLQLLARGGSETLQRYAIVLELLQQAQPIARADLEAHATTLAERLSAMHGINAPEFFDKKVLTTFIAKVKELDYIVVDEDGTLNADYRVGELSDELDNLLDTAVLQTIRQSVRQLLK